MADTKLYKRPKPEHVKNIGFWESILEFLVIFSLAFNTTLFFIGSSNPYNLYNLVIKLKPNYTLDSGFNYGIPELNLLIILVIEHIFLALIFILKFVIEPCPHWIVKENETLLSLIEDSKRLKFERDVEMIETTFKQELSKARKEIFERNNKLKALKEKNNEIKNEINILKDNLQEKNEVIEKKLINIDKEKSYIKKVNVSSDYLVDLKKDLEFNKKKYFNNIIKCILLGEKILMNIDEEEKSIKTSMIKMFVISQLTNTFNKLEKEIVLKKMNMLLMNINNFIIICNECNNISATVACKNCEQIYCNYCFLIHNGNFPKEEHYAIQIIFDNFMIDNKESSFKKTLFSKTVFENLIADKDSEKEKLKEEQNINVTMNPVNPLR